MKAITFFFVFLAIVCSIVAVFCFVFPYLVDVTTYLKGVESTVSVGIIQKIENWGYVSSFICIGSLVEYLIIQIDDPFVTRERPIMRI